MRKTKLISGLIVIILILAGGLAYVYKNKGGTIFSKGIEKDAGNNISDYSAVFLSNGQVYFGKITSHDQDEIQLADIYYLQVNQSAQLEQKDKSSTQDPQVSLVKLGSELHGPNDLMHINMKQVLFTESMKTDSKVVKAIQDDKNKK